MHIVGRRRHISALVLLGEIILLTCFRQLYQVDNTWVCFVNDFIASVICYLTKEATLPTKSCGYGNTSYYRLGRVLTVIKYTLHGYIWWKSVDTAGKLALTLVNFPRLKVSKASEETVPSSREILLTFVSWGARTCLPPYKRL